MLKGSTIFELYEETIGFVPPLLFDELKIAEANFSQERIKKAFEIAVRNNYVREWRHVRVLLEQGAEAPNE